MNSTTQKTKTGVFEENLKYLFIFFRKEIALPNKEYHGYETYTINYFSIFLKDDPFNSNYLDYLKNKINTHKIGKKKKYEMINFLNDPESIILKDFLRAINKLINSFSKKILSLSEIKDSILEFYSSVENNSFYKIHQRLESNNGRFSAFINNCCNYFLDVSTPFKTLDLNYYPIELKRKETMILYRGSLQSKFKDELLKKFQNSCALTKITEPCLIEACHIVPLSYFEKLDSNYRDKINTSDNGFILINWIHRLFDNGLISFDDNLELLISTKIQDKKIKKLLNELTFEEKPVFKDLYFIRYHRNNIYKKD